MLQRKSRIQETLNLLTDAARSTNTIFFGGQKKIFGGGPHFFLRSVQFFLLVKLFFFYFFFKDFIWKLKATAFQNNLTLFNGPRMWGKIYCVNLDNKLLLAPKNALFTWHESLLKIGDVLSRQYFSLKSQINMTFHFFCYICLCLCYNMV